MSGVGAPVLVLLALFGLAGGVGISAIGPGGVLPTIGLFALTDLSPAQVAGTAIVTHIATGALGTAVYIRSGQLRDPMTRRTAALLAGTAVIGTPIGVSLNSLVSTRFFGLLLATFAVIVVLLMWYRARAGTGRGRGHPSVPMITGIGLVVAAAAGIVGVGGPMLTVPLLVVLGVPVLESLAAAQAQSVVIATVGTLGYLTHGAIDWPLAALIGIPELIGVVIGWKVAHALPTHVLKYALMAALIAVAPYLALRG